MSEFPSLLYSQDSAGGSACVSSSTGPQEQHVMNHIYGAGSVVARFAGLRSSVPLPFALESLLFPEGELHQHERYACELPVITSMGTYQEQAYRANGFSQIFPIGHPFYYAIQLYRRLHGEFPVQPRQGTLVFCGASFLDGGIGIDHEGFAESLSRLPEEFSPICVCFGPEEYERGDHQVYREYGFPQFSLGPVTGNDYLLRLHDLACQFSYSCSGISSDLQILSVLSGCVAVLPPGYISPFEDQWGELFSKSSEQQQVFADVCCGKSSLKSGEELRNLHEFSRVETDKVKSRMEEDARRRCRRFHLIPSAGIHSEKMDPDGWVEKEFSLVIGHLAEKFKGIELRFDFPYWFELERQELKVFLDSELRVELPLKRGVYRIHIPASFMEKAQRLNFCFNDDFQLPGEIRKRAARLGEVRLVEEIDREWAMVKCEQLIYSDQEDWDRVLVVVGPSGGGKSRLIDQLTAKKNVELTHLIDLDGIESWSHLDLSTMTIKDGSACRNVLVHYELNRGFSFAEGGINFKRDQRLWDKIKNHPKKVFITLNVSAELLEERYEARRADFLIKKSLGREDYRSFFRTGHEAEMMAGLYASPAKLEQLYEHWFQFCLQEGFDEHWVISGVSPKCEIWKLGKKDESIQPIAF